MKHTPYSSTKINLFSSCKYSWFLTYIQKVKVKTSTKYFEKGKFFHHVLEHYPNTPGKFKFKWATEVQQDAYITAIQEFISIPEVRDLLTKFALRREETCNLTEDYQFTDKKDKALFTGYVDYIGQEHPGELIIADWKTSKKYEPNVFQLYLYAFWAFSIMTKIDKIKIGFCYVEDKSLEWMYFERDRDFETIKNTVINKIQEIEECGDFKKNPSKGCNFCPFFDTHCKPFAVSLPGVVTCQNG